MHRTLTRRPDIVLLLAAAFTVVGCTSAATEPTGDVGGPQAEAASQGAVADQSPAASGTVTSGETQPSTGTGELERTGEAAADPADAWRHIELTDVATGGSFTLAALEGQVVAIEPMAIWCPNCKAQQDEVKRAFADIERSGARFISLGVDPNERADALVAYADRHGYAWTFVRSPRQFSRALSDLFGPQVLAVPSTPLIVLDRAGEVAYQGVGAHPPDALLEILAEAGA